MFFTPKKTFSHFLFLDSEKIDNDLEHTIKKKSMLCRIPPAPLDDYMVRKYIGEYKRRCFKCDE